MTRQNFYQGQSVAPEHLNKLQTYAEQGQADLIASLLGYGIVNGFEISTIEGHIVGVTAGLAFNLVGERLVLAEGQQVNLAQYIPNVGDKIVKLGIIRNFIKTDPVTDSMGNVEQTTWTPTVQFITGESLDSGIFELAEIKINPLSVVEIKATEAYFTTLSKQVTKAHAFSTDRLPESTIANIDADILNINKKSFADTIRDLIYPIDITYTQYPDETTGIFREKDAPLTLFGGVWEKQFETKSVFFRTEGAASNESRDETTGIQTDAMQRLTGTFVGFEINTTGVFSSSASDYVAHEGAGTGDSGFFRTHFNSENVARTSTESRAINIKVIIWKRIR